MAEKRQTPTQHDERLARLYAELLHRNISRTPPGRSRAALLAFYEHMSRDDDSTLASAYRRALDRHRKGLTPIAVRDTILS